MSQAGAPSFAHQYCINCAYPLVGLPEGGACPECGTEIERSLRESSLSAAAPDYLANLNIGLRLVLTGILLSIVVAAGSMVAMLAATGMIISRTSPPPTLTAVLRGSAALSAACGLLVLYGYWLYTTPDPAHHDLQGPARSRLWVRVMVVLNAVVAINNTSYMLAVGITPRPSSLMVALGWIGTATSIAQFFLVLRYTRWIATRIPDDLLIRRARTYMWLLPLVCVVGSCVLGLGPLVAMILYWLLLNRVRRHFASLCRTGGPAPFPNRIDR